MAVHSSRPRAANPAVLALLPIIAVAFLAYLVMGLALPVLPLHVHEGLGLSTFGGLVAGSQLTASLVSRVFAGRHVRRRGPQRTVAPGLVIARPPACSTCAALVVVRLLTRISHASSRNAGACES